LPDTVVRENDAVPPIIRAPSAPLPAISESSTVNVIGAIFAGPEAWASNMTMPSVTLSRMILSVTKMAALGEWL
jgi:hypothetical protein